MTILNQTIKNIYTHLLFYRMWRPKWASSSQRHVCHLIVDTNLAHKPTPPLPGTRTVCPLATLPELHITFTFSATGIQFRTVQYIAMQCNAMQCNAMQCNAMQCNAMQCNAMQCNAMQCNAMQCNAMQCNAMQCNAMQCNAMQCNAMQCNAMQCNAMQYNTILLFILFDIFSDVVCPLFFVPVG